LTVGALSHDENRDGQSLPGGFFFRLFYRFLLCKLTELAAIEGVAAYRVMKRGG